MQRFLWALLAAVAVMPAAAVASPSAIGNETAAADQSADRAQPAAEADAKEAEEFRPPPGYRMKKRGEKVVYCKKDLESGTRFASEVCYDEAQLREMQVSRELGSTAFDQSRRVCASYESCGG